jgi:hypothetical protein
LYCLHAAHVHPSRIYSCQDCIAANLHLTVQHFKVQAGASQSAYMQSAGNEWPRVSARRTHTSIAILWADVFEKVTSSQHLHPVPLTTLTGHRMPHALGRNIYHCQVLLLLFDVDTSLNMLPPPAYLGIEVRSAPALAYLTGRGGMQLWTHSHVHWVWRQRWMAGRRM